MSNSDIRNVTNQVIYKAVSASKNLALSSDLICMTEGSKSGGGGGPTTKKTKDILQFCRRHDLFCSFLFSV